MIKVALADDHALILKGIQDVLATDETIKVVFTANNGKAFLEQLSVNPEIQVALLDLDMPEMTGMDVLEQRQHQSHGCRIIILSVHDEKAIIQKVHRLGAMGYLLKKSNPATILEAVHSVAEGKPFFDQEVINITLAPDQPDRDASANAKMASLTDREKEIIRLITEGHSNAEIGEKLFISKRTVDTHRTNLMNKLQLKNTVELVKFALKNGLSD